VKPFLDINILVYANANYPRKSAALACLATGGIVSVQVLNEFANILRKKQRRSWNDIAQALEDVRVLLDPPRPLTLDVHLSALTLARDRNLNLYDALIIAAALEAGCTELLSEDLQHGCTINGLTVRNPFL
jgi:predicted nucleic acid-binding protein